MKKYKKKYGIEDDDKEMRLDTELSQHSDEEDQDQVNELIELNK